MEEKKAKILEMLEDAQEQAEMVVENIKNYADDIENCETAEELQDKLRELSDILLDAEFIASMLDDVTKEDDDELQAMVESEWEAKEEAKGYHGYCYEEDTEVVPMGDHYDVIIRRTGEIIEQIW